MTPNPFTEATKRIATLERDLKRMERLLVWTNLRELQRIWLDLDALARDADAATDFVPLRLVAYVHGSWRKHPSMARYSEAMRVYPRRYNVATTAVEDLQVEYATAYQLPAVDPKWEEGRPLDEEEEQP